MPLYSFSLSINAKGELLLVSSKKVTVLSPRLGFAVSAYVHTFYVLAELN
jgi:hypothetical protein